MYSCNTESHRRAWYVLEYKATRSGSPSRRSGIACAICGADWRSSALYVETLPRSAEDVAVIVEAFRGQYFTLADILHINTLRSSLRTLHRLELLTEADFWAEIADQMRHGWFSKDEQQTIVRRLRGAGWATIKRAIDLLGILE